MAARDVPTASAALPSGHPMPLLGFGTWQIIGPEATTATTAALTAGYRHIDTATMYANEGEIGAALASADIARDDVFVTTKFPPNRPEPALQVLHESLELLGTPLVDLWLIHWPPPEDQGHAVWKDFIRAREQGLTRDIGVSNYSLEQLDELATSSGIMPAVNQIKWSPLLFDQAVLDGHAERGVVLEGYSALRGGTLEHPIISAIAKRVGRTPAQVIIRWHLQHDTVAIPKSREQDRIIANAAVNGFELSDDDMAALDALGN